LPSPGSRWRKSLVQASGSGPFRKSSSWGGRWTRGIVNSTRAILPSSRALCADSGARSGGHASSNVMKTSGERATRPGDRAICDRDTSPSLVTTPPVARQSAGTSGKCRAKLCPCARSQRPGPAPHVAGKKGSDAQKVAGRVDATARTSRVADAPRWPQAIGALQHSVIPGGLRRRDRLRFGSEQPPILRRPRIP
jgi:hypothetical protein